MMDLDHATLATIAGIIAVFGAAMIFFRIQRELAMEERGERIWLPLADWLLVIATLVCSILVIVPLIFLPRERLALPAAASGAAAVLVAGYLPAILSHYRIIFSKRFGIFGPSRTGPYVNPEPSERFFFYISALAAVAVFVFRLCWAG